MSTSPLTRGIDRPGFDWIDRDEYPFESHYLDVDGGRVHYVDEGQGTAVVMVHGTPTWSFMYRRLVKDLATSYRCVVPDHLGFGLSDRPEPYILRPRDHARNLAALVDALGLHDVVLVVHDFGGPIGLSYAIEHPENVRALVVMNTWLWSLADIPSTRRALAFAGSPIGRLLYTYLNFSARVVVPTAWGRRTKLTRAVHRHYTDMFPTPRSRQTTVQFAREALGSSAWYEDLWGKRGRIRDKDALLVWGLEDPAFGGMLSRWTELFPNAEIHTYADVGHFVPEEVDDLGRMVAGFLGRVWPEARA